MADSEHPIVSKLVTDPASPPKATIIPGYVGRSSRGPRYTRIYSTLGLDSFVDVPVDAVLHREDPPAGQPLAASTLWIKSDAPVVASTAGPGAAQAAFLAGDIASSHLTATPAGLPGGGTTAASVCTLCPTPTATAAPSVCRICPTPTATTAPSVCNVCVTQQAAASVCHPCLTHAANSVCNPCITHLGNSVCIPCITQAVCPTRAICGVTGAGCPPATAGCPFDPAGGTPAV